MRVYIGFRIDPLDGDKEIKIVTVSRARVDAWITEQCEKEPYTTFLYTLRRVEDV